MISNSRQYVPHRAVDPGRWPDVAVAAGSPVRAAVARALFVKAVATLPVRVWLPGQRLLGEGPPGSPVMVVNRPRDFFRRLGDSGLIGFGESAIGHKDRIPAVGQGASPALAKGGETEGPRRFAAWFQHHLASYPGHHDDLAGDKTSRLGAYLRFGCLSPLEAAISTRDRPGGEEFCRQLAWRDFFYQATTAFPDLARQDYRPGPAWRGDKNALAAWRAGRTGIPIVDAGLRQLAAEGFMHNRARMITASFLTRNLGLDWRHGYRHFAALLADGDVASNAGNWQWVAGTGHNTRRNRVMNPLRQARRLDPEGEYVRRYVPELADLHTARIHTPWRLDAATRCRLGYPDPLVEPS